MINGFELTRRKVVEGGMLANLIVAVFNVLKEADSCSFRTEILFVLYQFFFLNVVKKLLETHEALAAERAGWTLCL